MDRKSMDRRSNDEIVRGEPAAGEVLPRQRNMGAELAWMVKEIVRQLVTDPERAVVTGATQQGAVVITVSVASGDVGRIIGKSGITARSLRTILDAAGHKNGVRCLLNIEEAA